MREFGRAGWVVGVGTPDGDGMVTASRWSHHLHRIERPRGHCDGFLADMHDVLAEYEYDVVFGGSDDYLGALAVHCDSIDSIIGHPAASAVTLALDKLDLARRAELVGIVSPPTYVATDDVINGWSGPLVVKCRSHWHADQRNVYRIESRRYPSVDVALDRIRTIRDAGFEPIVQLPVDGRLGALSGLFRDGRLVGRVQHEAHRVWPTPSGVSSRAITVDVDPELAERCEQLLADLGWEGIVELQFLTDAHGHRHLIDLNGRFYGSMALAIAAGVPLPTAWARHVLGELVESVPDGRVGVRFSWIAGDLRRAIVERRGGLVRDVVSSVAWAHGAATCVWDVTDLGPIRQLATARLRTRSHDDGAPV